MPRPRRLLQEEGGQRVVLKAQLSLKLACFFLNPILLPPALSCPVDASFPLETQPASYLGGAA